jgi:Tfp pilus assembly PilM family ATPase
VLDAVSAEMAGEIQKTFDFFSATSSEGPVDQLVLSGGCALTPQPAERCCASASACRSS